MCVHKGVEQANSKEKKVENAILRRSLLKFVKDLEVDFPMCEGKILKPFLDKFWFGAETLVHAFRNSALSSEKLIKAFDTAGQHLQIPVDVPECFGFPS